ncbi:MAG: hypothetical protein GKR90_23475 [Pseudomonadales bacterium]|nr:hypothetical protein [Pseudomonadales bacterium]
MRCSALLLILTSAFLASSASATESRQALTSGEQPPWLQPDVLRAAVAIELSEAQKPQFQQAISDLINGQIGATNRLLRGNNVSNLKRRIKSSTNRQFMKMDQSVAEFLSPPQFERYQAYRTILRASLNQWVLKRGSTNPDSKGKAHSTLTNEGYGH